MPPSLKILHIDIVWVDNIDYSRIVEDVHILSEFTTNIVDEIKEDNVYVLSEFTADIDMK